MSKAFRDHFADQFRKNKKITPGAVLASLSRFKAEQPLEQIAEVAAALEIGAIEIDRDFRTRGRPAFRDLLWLSTGAIASLEREFLFAPYWLRKAVPAINKFIELTHEIENLFLTGNYEHARHKVVEFRNKNGWTVWGVELEIAIASTIESSQVRTFISELTSESKNRISTLLAHIIRDRNDDAISIVSFIARCDNTFSNIPDKDITTYFKYRSYGNLENIETSLPIILDCDLRNSIYDYYESLIDGCESIAVDIFDSRLREKVKEVSASLLDIGIKDYRLNKINFLVGGKASPFKWPKPDSPEKNAIRQRLLGKRPDLDDGCPNLTTELCDSITKIHLEGAAAHNDIRRLYKFGINFRGLGIGLSVGNFGTKTREGLSKVGVCSPWSQFASSEVHVDDFLGLHPEIARTLLKNASNLDADENVLRDVFTILDALSGNLDPIENLQPFDRRILWVAKELIEEGNTEGALKIASTLDQLDSPWPRHAKAIRILSALANGDMENAIEISSDLLIVNWLYAYELPLKELFHARKWSDFKSLDMVKLGIVSNYAHQATNDRDAKYYCKMACKAFLDRKQKEKSVETWGTLSPLDQRLIIDFLNLVWVDENLVMAGFQSTQDVRSERIRTLQLLIQLDPSNEPSYANSIKDLTFNETLWKGLRHINETRIFVNEAAIARWAEKELSGDFSRWKESWEDPQNLTLIVDEILQKYLAGADTDTLFASLHGQSLTENDAALLGIGERLLHRFLMDPADGLNCYLSSRIRHGTLKGTLLGPLEEAGLVGVHNEEFMNDRRVLSGGFNAEQLARLSKAFVTFNDSVASLANNLVREIVQIRSKDKPNGFIYAALSGDVGLATLKALASQASFTQFIYTCFEAFWSILRPSLGNLASHFRTVVKTDLQTQFDSFIECAHELGDGATALVTSLRTIATTTQAQCDIIANWFQSERSMDQQIFTLNEAIEITKSATKNVYRMFPVDVVNTTLPSQNVPLTSLGLLAITDCLYVILENAWKHSGLGPEISSISITVKIDSEANVLNISVANSLSAQRYKDLKAGALNSIREQFLVSSSLEKATIEGGSGFAKLSRLIRRVDTTIFPEPLAIDLVGDGQISVTVCIPVYPRGNAYDAYFE